MLSVSGFELERVVDYIIEIEFLWDLVRMIDFGVNELPMLIELTWILIIVFAKDKDWSQLPFHREILRRYHTLLEYPSELLVEQVESLDHLGTGQFHWLQ